MGRAATRCGGVLLAVLLCAAQGCGGDPTACTLIGGREGISVMISQQLFVRSGDVVIRVCDEDGCATTTRPLDPFPSDAPTPSERGQVASFHQLGQTFDPGKVDVTVTLHGPRGRTVAQREARITLVRTYPNGKRCDGAGFVGGGLDLRADDRV